MHDVRMSVLVAGDDTQALAPLAFLLRLWGYQVQTAADAPALLRLAQTDPPEVVILDLGLLDGFAAAEQLRGLLLRKHLLIALTEGPPAAGFDHCLSKPADVCELRSILKEFHQASGAQEGEFRRH